MAGGVVITGAICQCSRRQWACDKAGRRCAAKGERSYAIEEINKRYSHRLQPDTYAVDVEAMCAWQ